VANRSRRCETTRRQLSVHITACTEISPSCMHALKEKKRMFVFSVRLIQVGIAYQRSRVSTAIVAMNLDTIPSPRVYRPDIYIPHIPNLALHRHYRSFIFFICCAPAYNPRSIAAATVSVPPMTAHTPTRKEEKLLERCSRLMTFMGEMSIGRWGY